VAFNIIEKTRVDWRGRHLTPTGYRGKVETPQAQTPRRLDFLPAESKCLQRKGTVSVGIVNRTQFLKNANKKDVIVDGKGNIHKREIITG
jgi:hypothetical protein